MIVRDQRRPQQDYEQDSGHQHTGHDQPQSAGVDNSVIHVVGALTPLKSIQVPRVNNSADRCDGHLSRQCAINTPQFQWCITTGLYERADEKLNGEERKESIKNQLRGRRPAERETQNAHRDKHGNTCEHASGDADQKNSKKGPRCGGLSSCIHAAIRLLPLVGSEIWSRFHGAAPVSVCVCASAR